MSPPDTASGRFEGQRFLLVLSVVLLLATAAIAWPYRAVVVFALILGYLLHKPHVWLSAHVRYRALAAALMLVAVALALVLPFVVLGFAFVQEALVIAETVQSPDGVERRVREALERAGVPGDRAAPLVSRAAERAAEALQSMVVPAVRAATEFTLALVVFFILLYFVLVDGPALADYVRRVMPLDPVRRDRLLARTGERVRAIFLGSILISLLQGTVAGVGWWVLGLPAPVFWGSVMVLLSLVPVVGPFIVLLPAALYTLAQGNVAATIGLLVLNFIMVGLIDDLVRPWVISRLIGKGGGSGAHPALLLVGILGGIVVFGVSGLLLGPLVLTLLGPVVEAWSRPEDEPLKAGNASRASADGDEDGDGHGDEDSDEDGEDDDARERRAGRHRTS